MRNVVGDPVMGEDFFGRQMELELLWRKVERQSLVLAAPRRVGKTSLMYRMRDAPRQGWRVVHFNAESCSTANHFVAELLASVRRVVEDAWWERLPSWHELAGFFARIEKIDAKVLSLELVAKMTADRWRGLGAELLSRLAESGRTLVLIDELPYFVQQLARREGPESVEAFLHWCRSMRQDLAGRGGGVRFILYGSIGLDAVLRRLGLSATVNDLDVVRLGPFDDRMALDMLARLADGEGLALSHEAANQILTRLGDWYIPFHLQLIFSRLRDRYALRYEEPTAAVVDKVYAEELLNTSHRKYFAHWDERLDSLLSPAGARLARRLLTTASGPEGLSRDTALAIADSAAPRDAAIDERALDEVLDLLLHDGYLVSSSREHGGDEGGRAALRFASALLRDWWRVFHPED